MSVTNSINAHPTTGTVVVGTGTSFSNVAYSTTPGASTISQWDANSNLSANSIIEGYNTTATAAATTTLTVASKQQQYFTGVTTQTVLLPVTSTLVLGQSYTIVNNSTGVVTVQSSGANTIQAMAANTSLTVTCILTSGTTAASWNAEYAPSSGVNILTQHDVLVGGAANAIVSVTPSTAGFVLTSNGTSVDPSFQILPTNIKSINVQTFSVTGTYTPTSGMLYCLIEAVGGGGGGGGVSGIGSQVQTASGGSGACYVRSLFNSATIGASQSVTIGAAGARGGGGLAGGNGGTTTVGSLLSAGGGIGGAGMTIVNISYLGTAGGATGSATGIGTVVIAGGNSLGAVTQASIVQASPAGTGGDSYFGRGGLGLNFSWSDAVGFGSGGSGCANNGTTGGLPGGIGAAGYVYITEYIA